MPDHFANPDAYVATLPAGVQDVMNELRRRVVAAVPGAEETIRYNMPTITVDGVSLVHLAAWKRHIGVYPLPYVEGEIEAEVARYRTEKGTGQFPLDEPIPYDLIAGVFATVAAERAAGTG